MAQSTFSYMHAYNNNYNICYFTSIKCQLIIIIIIITAKEWRCSDSVTYNLFTNEMPHSWIKGSCLGRGTRQQKWLIPGRNTDEKSVQLLTQPMKSENSILMTYRWLVEILFLQTQICLLTHHQYGVCARSSEVILQGGKLSGMSSRNVCRFPTLLQYQIILFVS